MILVLEITFKVCQPPSNFYLNDPHNSLKFCALEFTVWEDVKTLRILIFFIFFKIFVVFLHIGTYGSEHFKTLLILHKQMASEWF